jgi:hypothetical protein
MRVFAVQAVVFIKLQGFWKVDEVKMNVGTVLHQLPHEHKPDTGVVSDFNHAFQPLFSGAPTIVLGWGRVTLRPHHYGWGQFFLLHP